MKFKKSHKNGKKIKKRKEKRATKIVEQMDYSDVDENDHLADLIAGKNKSIKSSKSKRVISSDEEIEEDIEPKFSDIEDEETLHEENLINIKALSKKKKSSTRKTKTEPIISDDEEDKYNGDEEDETNNEAEDNEEEDDIISSKKHREKLMKLKETDPEFFKFMQQEESDLLDFEDNEDEEMEENEEDEEEEAIEELSGAPKARKDGSGRLIFDGNQYDYLEGLLDTGDDEIAKLDVKEITFAVEAFQACVSRVGADIEAPKYVINEQAIFENVIRLCFRKLGPILRKGMNKNENHNKKKAIKRYTGPIKTYLSGILLFLNEIQSEAVIVSTLKSIQSTIDIFGSVIKITRGLIKALVRIWTRKTLECRLMAFVCMNQLLKNHPEHLSYIYKSAYLAFVSNSREVTPETWPFLQFMHRTFAELTLAVPDKAYPYAFVYIRQTAIHLRNAIISKKRTDLVQTIYNWQYVQCLYLWVRVVSKAHTVNGAEPICELAYPLTQVIIGALQLFRAPRYLPLRFHCISLLIQLQASCTTYIPVLSLAVESLDELRSMMSHKPKTISVPAKDLDLDCIIKAHANARDSPAFRTAAFEHLFKLMLQAAHSMSSQPAFPDLCQPVLHRIQQFTKNCQAGDQVRLFRGLASKLKEHGDWVSNIMLKEDIVLHDEMNVRAIKFKLNNPDSPLRTYYRQWEKAWKLKQNLIAKAENKKIVTSAKKQKKENKNGLVISADEPPRKKKRFVSPASSKPDASVPDTIGDLGDWSD